MCNSFFFYNETFCLARTQAKLGDSIDPLFLSTSIKFLSYRLELGTCALPKGEGYFLFLNAEQFLEHHEHLKMSNNYNNTRQKARPTSTAFQRKCLKLWPYQEETEGEGWKLTELGTKSSKTVSCKKILTLSENA